MTVTVSLAVLLGVVVVALCGWAGLKVWHAIVCGLLGFCLASTGFAPQISELTTILVRLL